MITCNHCGASYEEFQSKCPACGAPLRVIQSTTTEKTEAPTKIERVHKLCHQYTIINGRDFKDGDNIPQKKVQTITKSFKAFPNGKKIFLYCDTSTWGNGKRGFLICEDGIYWQNDWTTSTNRNFLPWDKFIEREITLMKFDLKLGGGDAIGLSGLGSETLRKLVTQLFETIQIFLRS